MIPLTGCKQEQCVAETSGIQPATDRGPKISLMFTPWITMARNIVHLK